MNANSNDISKKDKYIIYRGIFDVIASLFAQVLLKSKVWRCGVDDSLKVRENLKRMTEMSQFFS